MQICNFSRQLNGLDPLGEKVFLLSSCFLLSVETKMLSKIFFVLFCYHFNLSLEMQPGIWLCSEILISVVLHALCFGMFCEHEQAIDL